MEKPSLRRKRFREVTFVDDRLTSFRSAELSAVPGAWSRPGRPPGIDLFDEVAATAGGEWTQLVVAQS